MIRIATSGLVLGLALLAISGRAGQLSSEEAVAAPAVQAVPVVNIATPLNGVVLKICVDEGDTLVPGTILAQLDNRLAVNDRDIKEARVRVFKAEYEAGLSTRDRYESLKVYDTSFFARQAKVSTEDELRLALMSWERLIAESYAQKEAIRTAELEWKRAELVLEMHQLKSPVGGVVKAVLKQPGEAVNYLETIVQIEPNQR